jgi:hypothetical protein
VKPSFNEAAANTVTVPEIFDAEDAEDADVLGELEDLSEDEEEQALTASSTAVPPTANCRVRLRAERIITGSLPLCRAQSRGFTVFPRPRWST